MTAVLGRKFKEVFAVEDDFALSNFVLGVTDEDIAEGGLAGAVRPHEDVDLAIADGEVHASENFFAFDTGMEISDF